MAMVYNATNEKVSTKLQGKWFTFNPQQKKMMDNDKALFISMERRETGLVVLPPQFDPESDDYVDGYEATPDGKAAMEKARQTGIDGLVAFHREVIKNNQVSLRKDLARADEKVDPAVEASEGELYSMKLVAKYMKEKDDTAQKKIDEVKDLMKSVGTL